MDLDETSPERILDTASIQNIDTARMALRWALERLHKLERDKTDLAEKARIEERQRLKAQDELAALQSTLSLRSTEGDTRELYYSKLEEFLTLQLQGKLDPAAVAKRELEAAQLQELLVRKEQQLERELQIKKAALERDGERLRTETEAQAKAQVRRAESSAEAKRHSLEQDYLIKLADVHEQQAALKQAERALAERQAHFEQYYAQQRAELHAELRGFKAEIDDQVQLRVQVAERIVEERSAAMQSAWTRERGLLLRELETWRVKAQDLAPRAIELEASLALAEDSARQARALADRQTILLEQHRHAAASERQSLSTEAERWKTQALALSEEGHGLREALSAAEERARRATAAMEAQSASFEESGKAWERERDALASEKHEWRARTEELLERNLELGKRFSVGEDALIQTKAAAERQIALLEERAKNALAEAESSAAELSQARERAAVLAASARDLEKKLASAHETLSCADVDRGSREERLGRRLDELTSERDALREELEAARGRAKEVLPRLAELERGLTSAEESEGAVERRLVRFQVKEAAWQREREILTFELAAERQASAQACARALEMETLSAAAQEELAQVRALGERQAARFDARFAVWESERAELERLKAGEAGTAVAAAPSGEDPSGLA